jgi:hypothetical protein
MLAANSPTEPGSTSSGNQAHPPLDAGSLLLSMQGNSGNLSCARRCFRVDPAAPTERPAPGSPLMQSPTGESGPGGRRNGRRSAAQPRRCLGVSGDLAPFVCAPLSAICERATGRTIGRFYSRPMRRGRCNPLCMTPPATAVPRSPCLALTRVVLPGTRATDIPRIRPRWRRSSR